MINFLVKEKYLKCLNDKELRSLYVITEYTSLTIITLFEFSKQGDLNAKKLLRDFINESVKLIKIIKLNEIFESRLKEQFASKDGKNSLLGSNSSHIGLLHSRKK